MKRITAADSPAYLSGRYTAFPFYCDGKPLLSDAVRWGMTLRKAGSMRFRWSETNSERIKLLSRIAGQEHVPVSLELIHSRTVYDIHDFSDTFGLQGDGMITAEKQLIPVVTVADCMPLFLYDPVTGVFGIVHSGWKGTGIIGDAVRLAVQNYGASPGTICIAIGPHIRSCCYIVDESRAAYFRENFCDGCVEPYEGECTDWNTRGGKLFRLSLEKANLAVLDRAGVRDENITIAGDCTSCNPLFGSFRRETAGLTQDEKWKKFTVQAAFCGIIPLNTL